MLWLIPAAAVVVCVGAWCFLVRAHKKYLDALRKAYQELLDGHNEEPHV